MTGSHANQPSKLRQQLELFHYPNVWKGEVQNFIGWSNGKVARIKRMGHVFSSSAKMCICLTEHNAA